MHRPLIMVSCLVIAFCAGLLSHGLARPADLAGPRSGAAMSDVDRIGSVDSLNASLDLYEDEEDLTDEAEGDPGSTSAGERLDIDAGSAK